MHRSLLKRFPLFVWLLFAVSSVSNFRPDTGGRRWTLIQVAGTVTLPGGTCAAFPSALLRLLAAPYGACTVRFQPSGVPQKRGLGCACVLRLPRQSSSGSQELGRHTLPGVAPSALRVPSPSPRPRGYGACALCLATTLQNLRRSLVRNGRPVCSAVGAAVLGAEPAPSPPPCLLRGWAGPQPASSSLDLLGPFVL